MSKETMEHLNTLTLIGMTDNRGMAWHYRAEMQGAESNHYPQAIPVEDVLRRLFNFEVVEVPLYAAVPTADPLFEGLTDMKLLADRKGMARNDTWEVLGLFKDGYQGHSYQEWLLNNVSAILDDDLGIGSAGLLRNGAQAWVSVEVPDTITTPEGVEFRPNLIACTSFDGSLATTYKRCVQNVVCDNTLAAGLSEGGQEFRVKHTRNSALKLGDAREALAVVHTISDDFAAEVTRLCQTEVTNDQWSKLIDTLVPLPEITGPTMTPSQKAGVTKAQNKQDALKVLYRNDNRVSPWAGTAFGVLQAFNTYDHHIRTVKGVSHRAQRNMTRAITGDQAQDDAKVLAELDKILCSV